MVERDISDSEPGPLLVVGVGGVGSGPAGVVVSVGGEGAGNDGLSARPRGALADLEADGAGGGVPFLFVTGSGPAGVGVGGGVLPLLEHNERRRLAPLDF